MKKIIAMILVAMLAFAGVSAVGLTAGASTPDDLIAEVEARLASF